jgi:hypothetical protein
MRALSSNTHLPSFFAHFFALGGSSNSNDENFEFPFSKSLVRLGVGGTSSFLAIPDLAGLLCCTSLGNVDRRGVKAVATLFADLRRDFRNSHDRFFAR